MAIVRILKLPLKRWTVILQIQIESKRVITSENLFKNLEPKVSNLVNDILEYSINNRCGSSFEEDINEPEEIDHWNSGFIIQPDLDRKHHQNNKIVKTKKFMGRRNSGIFKNQNSYVEISNQTLDKRNPPNTIRIVNYTL